MANHTQNGTVTPGVDPGQGAVAPQGGIEWFQEPENLIWVRLMVTALFFLLTWLVIKLGDRALTRSASRLARLRHLDEQKTRAMVGRTKPMRFAIRLAMAGLFMLAVLATWGLQTAFTGLLAGAGFAGIVIGLAAADTIGDIIAGFLIFYNHPFDIGDWVEVGGTEGIVDDVSLGATTILTFDNEKVTLPNRLVEGGLVRNFSARRRLRRRLVVGVEYGSHLGLAMKTLVDLANAHPEVFKDPAPSAVTKGFGSSSVDLELRFYVEPVRSSAIKVYTDLVHAVHDTYRKMGINIAFPHMQVVQGATWQTHETREVVS